MTSAKAIQIAKEIDSARCKGNWNALPELARRYKKHNPDGTGKLSLPCFLADYTRCWPILIATVFISFGTDNTGRTRLDSGAGKDQGTYRPL